MQEYAIPMGVAGMTADLPRTRRPVPGFHGIPVLLADDHALFAEALQLRLSREPDLRPVNVAYTVEQARTQLVRDHPGVVVLDVAFGDGSGLSLAEYVRDASPDSRVLMLTEVAAVCSVVAALRSGVRGWLPKTIEPEQLVRAIRGVHRGEAWLSPDLLGQALTVLMRRDAETADPLATLTPREREVLQGMVDGLGRAGIAQRLHVSTNTVRTHTQNILAKLGVHTTLESVALALRHGLRATGG
ncbi:response regulator transcription factor [Micromonospora sp. NPDC049679]|uniref:response regulator transcription factor n=1 Tax=Micromonospora sp. NPDC049679 TaxID=3155920 RepID=UPI0033E3A9CD